MIRCVMFHGGGLVIAVGIVEANIEKLRDGQPMTVPIGTMLKQVAQMDDLEAGQVTLMVDYGETHEAIIEHWNDQLALTGVEMPEHALRDARALDAQLREEGRI